MTSIGFTEASSTIRTPLTPGIFLSSSFHRTAAFCRWLPSDHTWGKRDGGAPWIIGSFLCRIDFTLNHNVSENIRDVSLPGCDIPDSFENLCRADAFLASFFTHPTCHTEPLKITLQDFIPLSNNDLLNQLTRTVPV